MFPPNLPAHAKLRPTSGLVADAEKWLYQGETFAGKELLDARRSSRQVALEAARMCRGTGEPAELIEHGRERCALGFEVARMGCNEQASFSLRLDNRGVLKRFSQG
jgi:hypothetical protein